MEGITLLFYAAGVFLSYFLGSIPFGFILAKLVKGIDIRTVGSGNIGATNVARVVGIKTGITALIFDVLKGFVATTLIPFSFFVIAGGDIGAGSAAEILREIVAGQGFTGLRILCGFAGIAGHVWTCFLRLKGGKGVATSLGVMLGLAPLATIIAFSVWIIVTAVTRYVSAGSIAAAVALPVAFACLSWGELGENRRLFAVIVVVGLLVIVRHRSNIKRLLNGTEGQISSREKNSPSDANEADGPD